MAHLVEEKKHSYSTVAIMQSNLKLGARRGDYSHKIPRAGQSQENCELAFVCCVNGSRAILSPKLKLAKCLFTDSPNNYNARQIYPLYGI